MNFINAGPTTITTGGLSPNDLSITGQVAAPNGLIKAGAGSLTLTAANAAVTNWSLTNGSLILNSATALGANALEAPLRSASRAAP